MKKRILLFTLSLAFLGLVTGCEDKAFHEDVIMAGGKYVTAAQLNHGRNVYVEYCMPCHGDKGDGKGQSGKALTPVPRDFTLGLYKFGTVPAGDLPSDEDFKRILLKGLHGTAMLPWDLRGEQLNNVIQYIKTFAPKTWIGEDKQLGKPVKISKDPFGIAHKTSAIAQGKEVYHAVANCQSCHRAYASKRDINKWSIKYNDEKITEWEDDLYKVKPQESEYEETTIPPDFTWHTVRSATTVKELYVRLAAGVGGTAMPPWQGTITDDEIWAVAYYVKSLMDLKDKPGRKKLLDELSAQ